MNHNLCDKYGLLSLTAGDTTTAAGLRKLKNRVTFLLLANVPELLYL